MKPLSVYVDAQPLLDERMSGIGQVALRTIEALLADENFLRQAELTLIVPFGRRSRLKAHNLPTAYRIKYVFLPSRVFNFLANRNRLPYMDLLFGRGVYVFFNFKNWPVARSKSVTYVHDVAHLIHPEFVESKNLIMLNDMLTGWLRRTDRIVSVSEATKNDIRISLPGIASKVDVVPNGVDADVYVHQSPELVSSTLKRYGIKGSYIMYLSNLEPRKNLSVLLDAFEQKDIANAYQLVIVGGMGWKNEELLSRIEALRKTGVRIVRPLGYVPDNDIPSLLSGARLLVQPSWHEGFGIAPLYAMACGTQVIASDIPAHREICGPQASYFDPALKDDLINKIRQSQKPSNSQRAALRNRALMFTWQNSADLLRKIILNLRS